MTLKITALINLIASLCAGYAANCLGRFYHEFLAGAPLPKLTEAVLWRGGIIYWLFVPSAILSLYVIAELAKSVPGKHLLTQSITVIGGVTISAFLIGSILPLNKITVSLS